MARKAKDKAKKEEARVAKDLAAEDKKAKQDAKKVVVSKSVGQTMNVGGGVADGSVDATVNAKEARPMQTMEK